MVKDRFHEKLIPILASYIDLKDQLREGDINAEAKIPDYERWKDRYISKELNGQIMLATFRHEVDQLAARILQALNDAEDES